MNDIFTGPPAGGARLSHDLHAVVEDAEQLLRLTLNEASGEYAAARDRLADSLLSAKGALVAMERTARARMNGAGRTTVAYARLHPWQALGLAAGLGVLAAMVASRR
jgi:ElaB/YqjD/DUF883 family membrane-anchored ribosome-binding protein